MSYDSSIIMNTIFRKSIIKNIVKTPITLRRNIVYTSKSMIEKGNISSGDFIEFKLLTKSPNIFVNALGLQKSVLSVYRVDIDKTNDNDIKNGNGLSFYVNKNEEKINFVRTFESKNGLELKMNGNIYYSLHIDSNSNGLDNLGKITGMISEYKDRTKEHIEKRVISYVEDNIKRRNYREMIMVNMSDMKRSLNDDFMDNMNSQMIDNMGIKCRIELNSCHAFRKTNTIHKFTTYLLVGIWIVFQDIMFH